MLTNGYIYICSIYMYTLVWINHWSPLNPYKIPWNHYPHVPTSPGPRYPRCGAFETHAPWPRSCPDSAGIRARGATHRPRGPWRPHLPGAVFYGISWIFMVFVTHRIHIPNWANMIKLSNKNWSFFFSKHVLEVLTHHPWRIHGAAIYGVPWIPSIYPSHVSIYTSTMDPMGYT
jgi:hypothetical protein